MSVHPITLTGRLVTLEPLKMEHAADLTQAGKNKAIWTYMRYGEVDTLEKMYAFINDLLSWQTRGLDLPFAVVYRPSGRAIGMTRRQVRRMIRYESVITALMGGVIGIVLGLVLGGLLAARIDFIVFALPWVQVIIFGVAAVIVGLLAAIFPARRAGKLNVLEALQYE